MEKSESAWDTTNALTKKKFVTADEQRALRNYETQSIRKTKKSSLITGKRNHITQEEAEVIRAAAEERQKTAIRARREAARRESRKGAPLTHRQNARDDIMKSMRMGNPITDQKADAIQQSATRKAIQQSFKDPFLTYQQNARDAIMKKRMMGNLTEEEKEEKEEKEEEKERTDNVFYKFWKSLDKKKEVIKTLVADPPTILSPTILSSPLSSPPSSPIDSTTTPPAPTPAHVFRAFVTMHGGYYMPTTTCTTDSAGTETFSFTNISKFTSNHNRETVQISPLGTSVWSTYSTDMLLLHLIFQRNINPLIASWYVHTQQFVNDRHDAVENPCKIEYADILKDTYKYFNKPSGGEWLNKISQYNIPMTNKTIKDTSGTETPNPSYGYSRYKAVAKVTMPPKPTELGPEATRQDAKDYKREHAKWETAKQNYEASKEFIGYLCGPRFHHRGYFLLDDYNKTITEPHRKNLEPIIDYISEIVAGGKDAFSDINTTENTNGSITIHYQRGFNLTQCRYFIAFVITQKIGLPEFTISGMKTPYKNFIEDLLKRNIDKETKQVNTTGRPFLVKSLDLTIPGTYEKTMPYLYDATATPPTRNWITKTSTNIDDLFGQEPVVLSSADGKKEYMVPKACDLAKRRLTPSTENASHNPSTNHAVSSNILVELKSNGLYASHINIDEPQFFKLALSEIYESHVNNFIDDNTSIFFQNCSALMACTSIPMSHKIIEAYKAFITESDIGQGKRITSNKSRKKYKKNTIKKSKRKRKKSRKTRRK